MLRETPPPQTKSGPLATDAIWPALIQEVRANRPRLRMWVETGTLTAIDGDTARVTFPEEQALAVQHCEEKENRAYLEELLSTLAGRALKLRCELRSDFTVTPVPAARGGGDGFFSEVFLRGEHLFLHLLRLLHHFFKIHGRERKESAADSSTLNLSQSPL